MDEKQVQRGWGQPGNSKKWHYFIGGMSLCRKWMYGGSLDAEDILDSPDNCAACAKKRAAQLKLAPPERGREGYNG